MTILICVIASVAITVTLERACTWGNRKLDSIAKETVDGIHASNTEGPSQ